MVSSCCVHAHTCAHVRTHVCTHRVTLIDMIMSDGFEIIICCFLVHVFKCYVKFLFLSKVQ